MCLIMGCRPQSLLGVLYNQQCSYHATFLEDEGSIYVSKHIRPPGISARAYVPAGAQSCHRALSLCLTCDQAVYVSSHNCHSHTVSEDSSCMSFSDEQSEAGKG